MYQRYYDSYSLPENAGSQIIPVDDKIEITGKPNNILGSFKIDDILLLGILIVMLSDDCDDKLMIIIIGFLFISGLK